LQFETALDHQRFCSESCRRSVIAKNQSDKWRAANPRPDGYTYKCNWCSNLIERSSPLGGKLKYHADCAEQAVSARNRRKNIKRRGVTPSAGTVEMLRQQAGDNCQLCLEPIDFVLQRTSRMGATIDHIHPISLGGTDDVSNLQLAHWICNNRKSNKVSERVNG
jgi:5-methylcytosine-specific restriction endonuclease McrA